eukprot:CFRG5925T1
MVITNSLTTLAASLATDVAFLGVSTIKVAAEDHLKPTTISKDKGHVEGIQSITYLDADQLEQTLKAERFVVCLYYGLWDTRSTSFLTVFEALAEKVNAKKGDENVSNALHFVAVDATTSSEVRYDRAVESFPRVRAYLFRDAVADYQDEWDIPNFAMFVEELQLKYDNKSLRHIGNEKTLSNIPFKRMGEVIPYFKETFFTEVKRRPYNVVLFGTRNCKRTMSVVSYYHKAAKLVDNPNVVFSTVDCDYETTLRARNHIQAYPTILIFREGKKAGSFAGTYTPSGIAKYVEDFVVAHPVTKKPSFKTKKQRRTKWNTEEQILIGCVIVAFIATLAAFYALKKILGATHESQQTSPFAKVRVVPEVAKLRPLEPSPESPTAKKND